MKKISKQEFDNMYRLRWKPNPSGLYSNIDIDECVSILRNYLNPKLDHSSCSSCVLANQQMIQRYQNWYDKYIGEFKVED